MPFESACSHCELLNVSPTSSNETIIAEHRSQSRTPVKPISMHHERGQDTSPNLSYQTSASTSFSTPSPANLPRRQVDKCILETEEFEYRISPRECWQEWWRDYRPTVDTWIRNWMKTTVEPRQLRDASMAVTSTKRKLVEGNDEDRDSKRRKTSGPHGLCGV